MVDFNSFIGGMFVCALMNALLSMASYFFEAAYVMRTKRRQKKKDDKEGDDE